MFAAGETQAPARPSGPQRRRRRSTRRSGLTNANRFHPVARFTHSWQNSRCAVLRTLRSVCRHTASLRPEPRSLHDPDGTARVLTRSSWTSSHVSPRTACRRGTPRPTRSTRPTPASRSPGTSTPPAAPDRRETRVHQVGRSLGSPRCCLRIRVKLVSRRIPTLADTELGRGSRESRRGSLAEDPRKFAGLNRAEALAHVEEGEVAARADEVPRLREPPGVNNQLTTPKKVRTQ